MAIQYDQHPDVSKNNAVTQTENTAGVNTFSDQRPEAVAQKKMKAFIRSSPVMAAQRKTIQRVMGDTAQRDPIIEEDELVKQPKFKDTVQRDELDEEELMKTTQPKFKDTVQREDGLDEEELLKTAQPKFKTTAQRVTSTEVSPNNTGMPDNLKSGIETLSGLSMDDVKVHYGSDKPAQLNAHAYAQGSDIHIAPGQEQHLPHEAWHVVQQKEGRVEPTMQLHDVAINDDSALEKEADAMGDKALRG